MHTCWRSRSFVTASSTMASDASPQGLVAALLAESRSGANRGDERDVAADIDEAWQHRSALTSLKHGAATSLGFLLRCAEMLPTEALAGCPH